MYNPSLGKLDPIVDYSSYRTKVDTPESKLIRDLSTQIKKIEAETEYFKEEGELPPQKPDYYKRLNII